jgi:hypothetical protein
MKFILSVFFALVIAVVGLPSEGHTTLFTANLDGASETPANASPGTGFAKVDLDPISHILDIQVTFTGLMGGGGTTASHIHGPTIAPGTGNAGVATELPSFLGFPLGVTSGTYSHLFDTSLASTWNPAFIIAHGGSPLSAEAAFGSFLSDGSAYLNIHTKDFPSGEIRGFFAPAPVSEPATTLLLGFGLVGLAGVARKKIKK